MVPTLTSLACLFVSRFHEVQTPLRQPLHAIVFE
jgi:hypothetical protein